MAKKNSVIPRNHPHRSAFDELANFKFSDLKKAVIQRGMDFELVVNSSHGALSEYFIHHYDEPKVDKRLEDFDKWMDIKLGLNGYEKDDPLRKFKQFAPPETQVDDTPKPEKKLKEIKVKKPKREKNNEFGVYGGTKKELTYSLAKDLLDKKGDYSNKELVKKFGDQLFEKVQKKFPDANDKSVKIWMKRYLESSRV